MIDFVLTAIRMAISVLVKTLLPSGGVQQFNMTVVVMTNQRTQDNGYEANLKPWHPY